MSGNTKCRFELTSSLSWNSAAKQADAGVSAAGETLCPCHLHQQRRGTGPAPTAPAAPGPRERPRPSGLGTVTGTFHEFLLTVADRAAAARQPSER